MFSTTESPYFFEWGETKGIGQHSIKAVAYDNYGNQNSRALTVEVLKDYRKDYLGDFDFTITTVEESNNQQTTTVHNAIGVVSINEGSPNLMLASAQNKHQYITIEFDEQNAVLATLEENGKLGEYSEYNIGLTGGFWDNDHLEFKISQVVKNPNDGVKPNYILNRTIKGVRR